MNDVYLDSNAPLLPYALYILLSKPLMVIGPFLCPLNHCRPLFEYSYERIGDSVELLNDTDEQHLANNKVEKANSLLTELLPGVLFGETSIIGSMTLP